MAIPRDFISRPSCLFKMELQADNQKYCEGWIYLAYPDVILNILTQNLKM